jgi:hypothetical protein
LEPLESRWARAATPARRSESIPRPADEAIAACEANQRGTAQRIAVDYADRMAGERGGNKKQDHQWFLYVKSEHKSNRL